MNTNLTYLYKDINYNSEWEKPAATYHNIIDLLELNPNIENGCDCFISITTNQDFEYDFQLYKNEPFTDINGNYFIEDIDLNLIVQINKINFQDISDEVIDEMAKNFTNELYNYYDNILEIFTNKFTKKQNLKSYFLEIWECEAIHDNINEFLLFTFRINVENVQELLIWDWVLWHDVFKQLHTYINNVNENIKFY